MERYGIYCLVRDFNIAATDFMDIGNNQEKIVENTTNYDCEKYLEAALKMAHQKQICGEEYWQHDDYIQSAFNCANVTAHILTKVFSDSEISALIPKQAKNENAIKEIQKWSANDLSNLCKRLQ